jgi:hypothetical protein
MKLSGVMLSACIAVLPLTGQAAEDFMNANRVMTGCRAFIAESNSDLFLQGVCVGVVTGVAGFCPPPAVTVGQEVRTVAAYIDARSNRLHEDFRVLALEALKDAWPCRG